MKEFPQNRNPAQNARMPMRPTWSTITRHRIAVVTLTTFFEKLLLLDSPQGSMSSSPSSPHVLRTKSPDFVMTTLAVTGTLVPREADRRSAMGSTGGLVGRRHAGARSADRLA